MISKLREIDKMGVVPPASRNIAPKNQAERTTERIGFHMSLTRTVPLPVFKSMPAMALAGSTELVLVENSRRMVST